VAHEMINADAIVFATPRSTGMPCPRT
jgi:multimeric flavodoxin WrbA